ncbi:MAG: hypothetical protein J6O71_03280 [Lachnospiraceae bacterium]|nr:hypothetical protein [Lachnospiraceae bacterium]
MSERKKQLLKRLEEFFKNDEGAEDASIFTAEELGTPMDMLRVLVTGYGPGLIDVLAEYSFIPFEGPEEVLYFSSVITIMTDIPKDGVIPLSAATARLNFFLPYGSFCISGDGKMLVYKSVAALRADHDDKKLYEDIELAADTALLAAEDHSFLLMQVAEGELLLEDYLAGLPEA